MRPGELIGFMVLCFITFVIFLICLFVFRKRLKIAGVIGVVFIAALTGYYVYFPTLQEKRHEKNYEVLQQYLQQEYPDVQYEIHNKPPLEEGAYINEFNVNRIDSPKSGIIYHVNDDEIIEFGHWNNEPYPKNKENVWKQRYYHDIRPLDEPPVNIEKIDMVEHNDYLVFALQIDGQPNIMIYSYSNEALGMHSEQTGQKGQIVSIEFEGTTYTYVPEDYTGDVPEGVVKGKVSINE